MEADDERDDTGDAGGGRPGEGRPPRRVRAQPRQAAREVPRAGLARGPVRHRPGRAARHRRLDHRHGGVATASVDAVWSSHNVEHLYAHEVPVALAEFHRVLRPGGFALITLPDLQKVAELVAADGLEDVAYVSPAGPIRPLDMLYGWRRSIARGNLFMAHHTGFTAKTLGQALRRAGFDPVAVSRSGFDLWARGTKP